MSATSSVASPSQCRPRRISSSGMADAHAQAMPTSLYALGLMWATSTRLASPLAASLPRPCSPASPRVTSVCARSASCLLVRSSLPFLSPPPRLRLPRSCTSLLLVSVQASAAPCSSRRALRRPVSSGRAPP
ncbi:uncharacterized protein B0H18DRAFT_1009460 [Fomitopsis serialis]|uniref:uncharacterized protein n=1 Tax=Fomitopsis serialis TaxID=139415 RepID=UPI002008A52E|nr:uncharacterized protein B0H18DRAFT_1009460 [Neoantrodia serialis]KAH9925285.1 hypothetical protein B0H18DRAFT_1009460 [Neoantrodia serialis]